MKRIPAVPPRTLALAFAANRADHLERDVEPFLAKTGHRVVVCDRYYLSSLVYQTGQSLSVEEVMGLNAAARRPDVTVFLNASTQTCYERMKRRQEDKDLFEKNLRETRQRYRDAIAFLRARGESIVEVGADGTIAQVLSDVLDVIPEYGPTWLAVQRPMSLESLPDVFSLNGRRDLKVVDVATDFSEYWTEGPIVDAEDLWRLLRAVKGAVDAEIAAMILNDLGSLFLDHISRLGYAVLGKLPWTDLDAFELEYELPVGIRQRGAALLLDEAQRHDVVTKKALVLDQLSDFMFVLDPRPTHPLGYYERDVVTFGPTSTSLSPSTCVLDRTEMAKVVLCSAISLLADEHLYTITSLPGLRPALNLAIDQWGLRPYWELRR